MTDHRPQGGILAALRRQGALAALLALALVMGATLRAYASGLDALGEEMCRVALPGKAAAGPIDSAAGGDACCDLCICAIGAAAPPPAGATLSAPFARRRRTRGATAPLPPTLRRPRRPQPRGPPPLRRPG
jgi:hypothetical protein